MTRIPCHVTLSGFRGFAIRAMHVLDLRKRRQASPVLLPVQTVGVMDDGRTYDHVGALQAVTSTDGMTADDYHSDHTFPHAIAWVKVLPISPVRSVTYVSGRSIEITK